MFPVFLSQVRQTQEMNGGVARGMNTISWMKKLIIAGILSVFFITVISYFSSFSGVHIATKSGATDYAWEPSQRKATLLEGIAFIDMDQNGYNNSYPVSNKHFGRVDTLLMGSSHMEAINIDADKNAGYILNELIPGYTYNIGTSGHTIYRCVKNLYAAAEEYHPTNIIIETDRVNLDVDEMRQVIDGEMSVIPSYDSGIFYYLQKYVPGIKVLYNQVSDWMSQDSRAVEMEEEPGPEDYDAVLDEFLLKVASSVDSDQHILIVYQPNTEIDRNGFYISTTGESDAFQEACEVHGIGFLDLSEAFEGLYDDEHILAHGFVNTAVGEGHMNEQGHRIFAEEVAKYIKCEWEE